MPSGSKPPAIVVENLSVSYRTTLEKRQTLKSTLLRLGRTKHEVKNIEALKAINLTVNRGEFLGIIGHNGAGKSTFLRTIAGILPPSSGRVSVYGDVTTLLSVGIGFNPQLTGRDNIRLSALANGYSTKEIAKKEDEIAEFSELGEFIKRLRA